MIVARQAETVPSLLGPPVTLHYRYTYPALTSVSANRYGDRSSALGEYPLLLIAAH